MGPQICFHLCGLTKFIDCNITRQENYADDNEVPECNRIEIGSKTTINHKSPANSGFWFRNSNPNLTIPKRAKVNFTSVTREFIYGVNNLAFTIEKTSVTTANGLLIKTLLLA